MIQYFPIVTGSLTVNGDLIVTGTGSMSASLALNSNLLQGTGSVGFSTTASLLAVSSSQQQISASLLTLTASYTALSSSYTALSGSYNTFSGSASTRVSQIESVYATTGSNSFRADQSITGSLVVSSTITAQTLVVQTVTSSIVYSSGSNLFGSALGDRQTFTGSVNITGSTTLNGGLIGTSATFNHNDAPTIKIQRNGGSDNNTVLEFTNATRSFFIGSQGTVMGLGGTNGSISSQPLQISSSGAAIFSNALTLSTITAGSILFAGTSGLISQNNGNLFYDNANTRLGINAGSSPAYTLSVGGTGNFTGALTGTSLALSTFLSVNNGTAGTSYIQFNYNPVDPRCKSWRMWNDQDQYGDFAIAQATSQGGSTYSPKFLITTAGNIGMGTATPNGPLDIVGATYDGKYTISLIDSAAVAADIGGGIYFGGNYTGTTKTGWAGILGRKDNANSGEYGGYLAFYTRTNGSGPAERMRIGSDGKVGIGTTTWYQPYTKLIVAGAIAYNNNSDTAVSDNSYGMSFAKKINIVAGSGANTIYSAAGSEAALYVVTGLNLTASSRFADIILYLGAGSTAPVVIASQTYSTGVTRTYANSGENLTLSLTGNSNTYTIRMTGMGANERT